PLCAGSVGSPGDRGGAPGRVGNGVPAHASHAPQRGGGAGRSLSGAGGAAARATDAAHPAGPDHADLEAPSQEARRRRTRLPLRRSGRARGAAELARERGRADDSLDREARKDLREIAARYNPFAVDVLQRIVGWMFRRIYDGVDVDDAGMKRLAEAGARAPLVLCPSHKSHFDYMVLSVVCDDYGLQPPHIAAGDNLNFWPVGRFLRAGGAFFLRPSFKGDRVYSA